MIDIHAHILPGIDDGPPNLEDCLEMARVAMEDGIRVIVATPHCLNGLYLNFRTEILSACDELRSALEKNGIPLTVLPGSEVYLNLEIIDELKNGRLMTLNDKGQYLFIELPEQLIHRGIIGLIKRLRDINMVPIITHPERNPAIQHNVELLYDFISAGALSQITADSLTGGFGRAAFRCCKSIIKQNMAHLVASDAHSPKARPPRLSAAFKKLSSLAGRETAERMILRDPQMILEIGRD